MNNEMQSVPTENTKQHAKRKAEWENVAATGTKRIPNTSILRDWEKLPGSLYHLTFTILIAMNVYKIWKEDNNFSFTITLEDGNGGKFDDIVLQCPIQNVAVYMQCKQKKRRSSTTRGATNTGNDQTKKRKTKPIIGEVALLAPLKSDQPFSISRYFMSFLESNHSQLKTNLYFLCTNAIIDDELAQYFTEEKEPTNNVIITYYKSLNGTFLQFNKEKRWAALEKQIKHDSISCLAKSLAQAIYKQNVISLSNPLHSIYSVLINNIIERSDHRIKTTLTSNPETCRYKFRDTFRNAHVLEGQSAMGNLHEAFVKECSKLLGKDINDDDLWKDILEKEIKIEWHFSLTAMYDALNLISPLGSEYIKIDAKIAEFYDKFRLVCTREKEELYSNAKQLLSKLTDAPLEAAYNSLYTSIFNVVRSNESIQINKNYLENIFRKVKRNISYTLLKEATAEYINSLSQKYTANLMEHEWLKNSQFYGVISTKSNNEAYYYRSSVDLNASSIIILQTLEMLGTKCLFIHESKFHQTETLENILCNVLEYLDVESVPHYIIVVLDALKSTTDKLFKNIPRRYQQRVIILTNDCSGDRAEKRMLVRNLTEEARYKLFRENEALHFFGTIISLEDLIQGTDDLAVLFDVLNLHAKATKRSSINLRNYEKIKKNYVQRDFETYRTCVSTEDQTTRDIKKCVELFKVSYFQKSCSFEELAQHSDLLPVLSLVRSALSEPEEHNDISELCEKNNMHKCFVFLDEAGYGKSTYFTWLAWRLSDQQPSLLVARMNAIRFSSEFHRLNEKLNHFDDPQFMVRILYQFVSLALEETNINNLSSTGIVEALKTKTMCANLLHFSDEQIWLDETKTIDLPLEQLLELRMFCNKFNNKQLVLLLDAFDEIAPQYSDVVSDCFTVFSKFSGIRNIYLSSRPYSQDVQDHFQDPFAATFKNYKKFQLKPFSVRHQILSLHKHFLNEVKEYPDCEKNHQTVVLGVVYAFLINRLEDLVKAPLLLHMAIEIFLPALKQNINFPFRTISDQCFTNEQFQTFQIVQSFVDRKLEILITDKSGSTDSSSKTVMARRKNDLLTEQIRRDHTLMAIHVMLDKSYTKHILSHHNLNDIKESITQGEEKTGIVVGLKNNIPVFIHTIFAEYFAASWLFHNKDKLKTDEYFKSQLFWNRGLDRTRDFFNQMIAREHVQSEIHLAVLNKSFERVKNTLLKDTSSVAVKDSGGRVPLHLALQHDNHQIMRYLLEKMSINSINSKDDIFGWSALDYAFVTSNKFAIKTLLEFEANVNLDNLLKQLFSNDNDNILIRGCHYTINLSTDEDIEKLAIETVKYLCEKRQVDITVPREQLNSLTMIQYCITKNMYELFKQFILHLENPTSYLNQMASPLFQAALAKNAYNVVCFLVDEFAVYPPPFKNNTTLFAIVKSAIALNRMKSFKRFLDQLCLQLNIDCADDTAIVIENSCRNTRTDSQDEHIDQYPKSCCVRKSKSVLLALPEYDERNVLVKDHLFETLLARAAHEGNVHMISHIIQKFQKSITNRTIVKVMRLLPKGKRMLHNRSGRAFQYLLSKTIDLESIDEHGRNLLHMTVHNGCFFMALCLIDAHFNLTLINERNRWNVFHYIASSESKYTNRALKLYHHFTTLENQDRFDTVDLAGNSVYEISILNNNFDIARDMIESTLMDPTMSKAVTFVLDTVNRLVELNELEIVLEFFKYLFEYGDVMWMKLYSTIRLRIPVI